MSEQTPVMPNLIMEVESRAWSTCVGCLTPEKFWQIAQGTGAASIEDACERYAAYYSQTVCDPVNTSDNLADLLARYIRKSLNQPLDQ